MKSQLGGSSSTKNIDNSYLSESVGSAYYPSNPRDQMLIGSWSGEVGTGTRSIVTDDLGAMADYPSL